jgi:predicted dehydrogenase
MTAPTLRGGIVGFGRMGVTHHAILNTHPGVRMVAVCDASSFIVSNLKKYGTVEIHSDFHDMLRDVALDFVVVCTPPDSHADIAVEAIARNLHIFLEKPFAIHAADGERILSAHRKNPDVVDQVGYFLRFNEVFGAVKRHLDAGHLGKLIYYTNEMYGRTVTKPWKESWRMKKSTGGGCLLEFASHCIDLADYLFGPPKELDACALQRVYSKDVDDAVHATFQYSSGLIGNLVVNWSDESYRRPFNRVEVFGDGGRIIADRQGYRIYLKDDVADGSFKKGWTVVELPSIAHPTRFELRGSEYTVQLDHFIDRILKKTQKRQACGFTDANRADSVMDDIRTKSHFV